MSDQFLGEIRMFGGNFAPVQWALCNGQTLPISQYSALFALIGTYYGGNGTSNFQLPNLQGVAPLDQGSGPGLTPRDLGETGGEPSVTLTSQTMAAHNHALQGTTGAADSPTPTGSIFATGHWATTNPIGKGQMSTYFNPSPTPPTLTALNIGAIGPAGGNQPHNNLMPYQVVTFIIAMQGIFPPRG
jgi:microcystin-dependent protein